MTAAVWLVRSRGQEGRPLVAVPQLKDVPFCGVPTYKFVEIDIRNQRRLEEFDAPNDQTAVRRIEGEARGIRYELWRDGDLIYEGVPRVRGR